MQWRGRRESTNVEDRRGMSGTGRIAAGGGIGTILLIVVALIMGRNPLELLNNTTVGYDKPAEVAHAAPNRADNEAAAFSKVVLAETEDVWTALFAEEGYNYQPPTLVLFNNAVSSACGSASSAVGPFYCPSDQKVYLDLSFFSELQTRFGATGDFASAYVIAHEVGHHIQNLIGISEKVQQMQRTVGQREANQLSVRLELQADFLAGVWAHHAQRLHNILDDGDIDEALNAAQAIGDDNIQKQAQGYVVPDGFTHGTSEQRKYWFKKGYTTGDMNAGDTFNSEI